MKFPVQILMDSCSNITTCRGELISQLDLQVVDVVNLEINGALALRKRMVSNLVLIELELETGDVVKLSAFSVPEVCKPITITD